MENGLPREKENIMFQSLMYILIVVVIALLIYLYPHPDLEEPLGPSGRWETTFGMIAMILIPALMFIEFFVFYEAFPGFMESIGLEKREISLLLVGSMVGIMMNVPVIVGENVFLGLNVGGALIPIVLSSYLIWKNHPSLFNIVLAVTITSIISYLVSSIATGLGIASVFPYYMAPPVVAFALAKATEPRETKNTLTVAYAAGTFGTLIGADIVRIPQLLEGDIIGAIGGAGSLDLVFLAGLIAGGMVLITSPRHLWHKGKKYGEVKEHLIPKRMLILAEKNYSKGNYGATIQYCKASIEKQIAHVAGRYQIQGDPEDMLLHLRVLPYMIHDYRAMTWLKGTPQDAARALTTANLLVTDLRNMEREAYRGLGSRAIAYLLDMLIILVILSVLALPLLTGLEMSDLQSTKFVIILSTILGLEWVIETGYFTLLEWKWGASIGKSIMGMRVIQEDGEKLSFMGAFTRNLLRILDILAILSLIMLPAYIIMYQRSERKQRIGDFLAGTVVLKVR